MLNSQKCPFDLTRKQKQIPQSAPWPVAGWNLGLIRGLTSESWWNPYPLAVYPDPVCCPYHPYPGNGRFGDFCRGAKGSGHEARGHRGHSGGTNISFSAAPCETQRPAPSTLLQCLLCRGEERGGGRTQTMLPFKALPSPRWGGEVCMGQSLPKLHIQALPLGSVSPLNLLGQS